MACGVPASACMQEVFKRVDGKAAVAAQPSSEEERTKALQVCAGLSAPPIYPSCLYVACVLLQLCQL